MRFVVALLPLAARFEHWAGHLSISAAEYAKCAQGAGHGRHSAPQRDVQSAPQRG